MDPPRCDPDVFRNGRTLCRLYGPDSWTIERWVERLRYASGNSRIDWSRVAGWAAVKALDPLGPVRDAIRATLPAFRNYCESLPSDLEDEPLGPFRFVWYDR